jgi:3-oxoacyl-[acyl-carrier-protein] synthase-3
MAGVRIRATGFHLPGPAIDNQQLERLVGPLPEEVASEIQVQRRHWIVDPATGEHHIRNSEMAARAARLALEEAGIEPAQVDLLVLSTSSPDYPLPPMVTLVQDELGIESCAAIEIRSGCAGAVEALDIARHYLERGEYHTAVVIGSEAISPVLVPMFRDQDPDSIRMRDRLVLYSFGDGAGAIVLTSLEAGAETGASDVLGSAMASVGHGREPAWDADHRRGDARPAPSAAHASQANRPAARLHGVRSVRPPAVEPGSGTGPGENRRDGTVDRSIHRSGRQCWIRLGRAAGFGCVDR